ncbi:hypothetical protein CVD28_03225 [Bacillus sp. M6-12]|uniref:hypothetical protein n=1 Tax=Bacillus sp. M6-12 TaxID=2054166 RepID=UPI000C77A6F8|nr:hypothetical protein [Bacillus sp. M6-12]PLS19442.1 hypothetical protein CVD28_03225 [Bacillus sp. M6-12]
MQDALFLIKDYIRRGTLLPSVLLNNKEVYQLIKDSGKYQVPSLQELKKVVKKLEIEEDDLYLSVNPFSPFVYIHQLTYVDIQNLNESFLDMYQVKKTIHSLREDMEKFRDEGDYESIIHITSNKYVLNIFHEVYNEVELEKRYSLFRETYTQMEYGFEAFQPDILEEVLTLNMDTSFKEQLKPDNKGYITIYRGEGSKSRGLEEAYSWTINQKIAHFFAKRFDKEGKVYQGKVHINDVIDYIDDRNEGEILVIPTNVKEIIKL